MVLRLLTWFFVADLEWKIIYVGSAESEEYDQTLDSVLVGPVPAGRHMFVFQVSWHKRDIRLHFDLQNNQFEKEGLKTVLSHELQKKMQSISC